MTVAHRPQNGCQGGSTARSLRDHQVRGDGGLGEARGGEDGEEETSARDASERNSEERGGGKRRCTHTLGMVDYKTDKGKKARKKYTKLLITINSSGRNMGNFYFLCALFIYLFLVQDVEREGLKDW